MKFRAVVITRNRILAVIGAALAVALISALFAFINFKGSDTADERLLKSGLADDREFSAFDKIKAVLGFDITEPETIARRGMGIAGTGGGKDKAATVGGGTDGGTGNSENTPQSGTSPAPQGGTSPAPQGGTMPAPQSGAGMPSTDEINAGRNLSINNATDYEVNLEELCAGELDFAVDDDGPQVLVVHTHTTECYDGDEMPGETERTTDSEKNVCAVGEVICRTLEDCGIKTYHDTTCHDYPTYQGSYTRELTTVTSLLERYPSIKVIFDVHRDAFIYEDGSKLTVTQKDAERPTARVMLVVGTDSMGLYHPNWRENLKFAAKIQSAAEIMYPGLTRPIDLRQERFNMHITTGSLLLEVGANGNTLEEAKNAGEDIAKAVAAVLVN